MQIENSSLFNINSIIWIYRIPFQFAYELVAFLWICQQSREWNKDSRNEVIDIFLIWIKHFIAIILFLKCESIEIG